MIFTLSPLSGSQSPGNGAVSSRLTWNRSATVGAELATAGGTSEIPSGISRLVRQIQPRDKPEIRTWTQSALKSSISNSSCALARNRVLPLKPGDATTAVPYFFIANRFFGCAWFFSTSSNVAASVPMSPASLRAGLKFGDSGAGDARTSELLPAGDENGPPASGNPGIGADSVGSSDAARCAGGAGLVARAVASPWSEAL